MNIIGRLLLKNILLVAVLASTDFIYKSTILGAEALTTRKALNDAVKKEKDSWQTKLNENQNKIKSLQTDLDNAFNENEKIQNEKAASEKTAKDTLMKITAEKENAVQELTNSKKTFEENSKKLNDAINKLQTEKEKLEGDLIQQKEDLKNAQKEYEEKIKAEQEVARKSLEEETNKLNNQISEKTNQLNKTLDTLKKLNQEYSNTKNASAAEEVKNLVEIEVLKSEVNKKKIELKALVNMAKNRDEARLEVINNLKQKINTLNKEFETLVESMKSAELKKLFYIEKLTAKLTLLKEKVDVLIKAGKAQEKSLLKKIKALIAKQKETQRKYIAIMEAYQVEEQKNLNLIDKLKFDLSKAIKNNKALLNVAKRMNEEKMKEDIADSISEANQLLKIDILNNKLRDSIRKNIMLIENTKKLKNNVDDLKDTTQKTNLELNEKVKNLANKLNDSNKKFEQLKKIYNNPKVWIKEVNSLSAKDLRKLFGKSKQGNFSKPFLNSNKKSNLKRTTDNIRFFKRNPINSRKQFVSNNGNQTAFIPTNVMAQNNYINSGYNVYNSRLPISGKNALNPALGKYYQEKYPKTLNTNAQRTEPNYQTVSEQNLIANSEKSQNLQDQKIDNKEIIKILDSKSVTKTKDDELVDFAIESIINAIEKMTDNSERKTNASMNLIGAEHDMPEKVDAVVNVIKEQFNPEVLNKALDRLSEKYIQKQNFVDESLKHMYGDEGDKIINW